MPILWPPFEASELDRQIQLTVYDQDKITSDIVRVNVLEMDEEDLNRNKVVIPISFFKSGIVESVNDFYSLYVDDIDNVE